MGAVVNDVKLADSFPTASVVGVALLAAGLTVAVAESCTGGLLGAVLTAIPGSSEWVRGGVIAYANSVKVGLLGVDADVLNRDGAVSAVVAEQMASGARRSCGADIGIGITGVAGPGGGSASKPVGLIYVSAVGSGLPLTRRLDTDGGREVNRAAAVRVALEIVMQLTELAA